MGNDSCMLLPLLFELQAPWTRVFSSLPFWLWVWKALNQQLSHHRSASPVLLLYLPRRRCFPYALVCGRLQKKKRSALHSMRRRAWSREGFLGCRSACTTWSRSERDQQCCAGMFRSSGVRLLWTWVAVCFAGTGSWRNWWCKFACYWRPGICLCPQCAPRRDVTLVALESWNVPHVTQPRTSDTAALRNNSGSRNDSSHSCPYHCGCCGCRSARKTRQWTGMEPAILAPPCGQISPPPPSPLPGIAKSSVLPNFELLQTLELFSASDQLGDCFFNARFNLTPSSSLQTLKSHYPRIVLLESQNLNAVIGCVWWGYLDWNPRLVL